MSRDESYCIESVGELVRHVMQRVLEKDKCLLSVARGPYFNHARVNVHRCDEEMGVRATVGVNIVYRPEGPGGPVAHLVLQTGA